MIQALYRGLTDLAAPVVPLFLGYRERRGKEDPARRPERLGIASRPRPQGRLAWTHAASVGELLSALPLIARLTERVPDLSWVVTSGTVTSARLAADRLPRHAIHQYVPLDRTAYVRRFLDHWRPDLAIWIESELWPNMLAEVAARAIPAALVNARLSARSAARWRFAPGAVRNLLGTFQVICAGDEASAARLELLGAGPVERLGNLKFSADPPPADPHNLARLAAAIGARPAWLAASTHEGEEEVLLDAHRLLNERRGQCLMVIAPRHPIRGEAIAQLAVERGFTVSRRTQSDLPDAESAVWVVDTMGELGLLYQSVPIAFIGGSIAAVGGHNPIEPAQLGAAILAGPHMFNFADMVQELSAAGGAELIDPPAPDRIAAAVDRLLGDERRRQSMVEAASRLAAAHGAVADRIADRLATLIKAGP